MSWFHLWLFLHVTAAILAFGPTFVFPLIGIAARNSPQNMGFALHLDAIIEDKLVIPFALSMPISGLGLVAVLRIEWGSNPWLIASLVLYFAAMFVALVVQRPVVHRLIAMAGAMRAPMPAGPGASPAGPPAEFLRNLRRVQVNGIILTVLFFAIMVLMIWKPGGNI
jgi:uncharacterized membrane protein